MGKILSSYHSLTHTLSIPQLTNLTDVSFPECGLSSYPVHMSVWGGGTYMINYTLSLIIGCTSVLCRVRQSLHS
jgi:hypothetical protein